MKWIKNVARKEIAQEYIDRVKARNPDMDIEILRPKPIGTLSVDALERVGMVGLWENDDEGPEETPQRRTDMEQRNTTDPTVVENPDKDQVYHVWHACGVCGKTWDHSQGDFEELKRRDCCFKNLLSFPAEQSEAPLYL